MPDFVLPFMFQATAGALGASLALKSTSMAILDADMLFAQGPRVEIQVVGFLFDADVHVVTFGPNFGYIPIHYDTVVQVAHAGGWAVTASPRTDITARLQKSRFMDITIAAKAVGASGALESATVYVIVPEVRRTAGTRVR